jgi:hypothetical protein
VSLDRDDAAAGTSGHVGDADVRAAVRRRLTAALEAAGAEVDDVGDGRLLTVLAGEWKRTIPVLADVGDRTLTLTSLFTAAPDERHDAVYDVLLRRNQRSGPVHFALDDSGDIVVVGQLPLAAADERGIDELLGSLLELCDRTFNQVLRAGFATYLEAEQRWRASVGLPPNPVGDPGAASEQQ